MDDIQGPAATAATAAPASLPAPSRRDWESWMRKATHALCNARLFAAKRHYLRALAIACAMLVGPVADAADAVEAEDRVSVFVATHLHLADLYRDADRAPYALAHVNAAHRALVDLMRDEHAAPALREAATRHSRETHIALLKESMGQRLRDDGLPPPRPALPDRG